MNCYLSSLPPISKGRMRWREYCPRSDQKTRVLNQSLTHQSCALRCKPLTLSLLSPRKMKNDVFAAHILSPYPRVTMKIKWASICEYSLSEIFKIPFHEVYCEFKSFHKSKFLCSLTKLLFQFLWKPWWHSCARSSCWSIRSLSFSEKAVLQSACCFLEVPFQKATLVRFHSNICKSHPQGKCDSLVTVLSFHGYCSGSRCCLWAKSLEIIMTSALLQKNRLCPHRKQGGGWALGHKVTLRKVTPEVLEKGSQWLQQSSWHILGE